MIATIGGVVPSQPSDLTVGVDIGTTSVKALMADGDGNVVASVRVPHHVKARHAGELAHDALEAWWHGPRLALAELLERSGVDTVAGICVSAMVPSLCAVDAQGRPVSDGFLYGDSHGAGGDPGADPSSSGEIVRFLAHLVREYPDASGYWPAQAVANASLSGVGGIDTVTAMTAFPLFDYTGWDPAVAAAAGLTDVARLPRIVSGSDRLATVDAAGGAALSGGTIDAFSEQLVAGADRPGDVLVILGATLIVWAVIEDWVETPGLWTVPHTTAGLVLTGGPSNASGLFLDWLRRLIRDVDPADIASLEPSRVPIWQPYLRGERVPLHDPDRRASLHGLDIGMAPPAVLRAGYEASGFSIRHQLDLAGVEATRLVATGGGVRDATWVQALADTTGVPVDVVRTPEGAALGAAFQARATARLAVPEAGASAWSGTSRRVEPAPDWTEEATARYRRYRVLADG